MCSVGTVRPLMACLAAVGLGVGLVGCDRPPFGAPDKGRARPSPTSPAPAPPPGLLPGPSGSPGVGEGFDWSRVVRDCAVDHGGSGLGTRIDDVMQLDATGDGSPEWLVVSECESSTSQWPQVVEVFSGPGPARLGTLLSADPVLPRDLVVSVSDPGRLTVTGRGLSPDAASCCPDLTIRRVFTWTGVRFILTESVDRPS